MPAYSFEALDAQGRPRGGLLEADTAKAARGQLRAQALIPLQVSPVDAGGPGRGAAVARWGRRVFNATRLTVWTRQLAGLVASGLQLERALTALAEESDRDEERHLVAAMEAAATDS